MDKQTFNVLFEDVQKALREERLSDALHALDGLMTFTRNGNGKSLLVEIRESYGMLLDYMYRGFVDPDRDKLLRQFVRRTYELADVAYRDFIVAEGELHYASVWNVLQKMSQPTDIGSLLRSGGSFRQLFEVAWTGPVWQKGDYESAHGIMESTDWKSFEKNVLISGVTLGALQVFDVQRLRFLLDLSVHPVSSYRVRALVGAVLVYIKYANRFQYYPEIVAQLRLMSDVPGFVALLQTLQMQFFLSLETKKIEKSLREEILPEVMKKAKDIHFDKSLGFEELQDKLSAEEFNPEWDKDGKVSELSQKMKELAAMQMKGADVYIGSFKMFKQKFAFFNVAVNWFCPFSFDHPDLVHLSERPEFLKDFLGTGSLCDSDKYSFCLMMQEMSTMQGDFLRQQMDATFSENKEALQAANQIDEEKKTIMQLRSYVQDLYRFFTLFRYRDVHQNPFAQNLFLTDFPPFDELLSNENTLKDLADFTFGEKSYLYALKFYERLPETAEHCQKIGFCYQSVKNYHQAIFAYEKANLLKENSAWTLRQLGNCYRLEGDFKRALRVYEQLETIDAEDVSLLLRLGECYIHEHRYDEAFAKLYKADYLNPDTGLALRALAWCSLLTGKLEQADQYYSKILSGTPQEEDFLNAGHAAWLSGDVKMAVTHYRKILDLEQKDFASADFFGEDEQLLLSKGLSTTDLHLMIDLINKDRVAES